MLTASSTSRRSSYGSAQSNKHAVSGTREVFTGVHRIWGTMKACTVPTVSITRLTGIGSNVQVKKEVQNQQQGQSCEMVVHTPCRGSRAEPAGAGMGEGSASNFMEA